MKNEINVKRTRDTLLEIPSTDYMVAFLDTDRPIREKTIDIPYEEVKPDNQKLLNG
jgi:hypothetical protein